MAEQLLIAAISPACHQRALYFATLNIGQLTVQRGITRHAIGVGTGTDQCSQSSGTCVVDYHGSERREGAWRIQRKVGLAHPVGSGGIWDAIDGEFGVANRHLLLGRSPLMVAAWMSTAETEDGGHSDQELCEFCHFCKASAERVDESVIE